jgi:predicted ferric reductase
MSWRISALIAAGLVIGVLTARAFQDPESGTASWDGLRAAGFAAYLLLWLGLVTGMAVHMKYRPGPLAMTWLLETHRISSALSLSFVAGHLAGVLVDPTIAFSVLDVLVGVSSHYRPIQVGFGAMAVWLSIIVLGTTALSHRLPYVTWRNVHYLSFPAYIAALVHSITAGTDGTAPLALVLYASTASFAAAMVVARLFGRGWVPSGEPARP